MIRPMPQQSLSLIRVRTRPARRSAGVLLVGTQALVVTLGRTGIRADKREGDGATPRGQFRLKRLWWRADRMPQPRTMLPVRPIDRAIAWCEDPRDRRYNRPFHRATGSGATITSTT
jgi:L,D-peptidoglycan transpeptidase YkuD (ErfK/YbiS/YcfS/YnhG family)